MPNKTVAVSIALRWSVAVRQSGVPQLIESHSTNPVSAVGTVRIKPTTRASHHPLAAFFSTRFTTAVAQVGRQYP